MTTMRKRTIAGTAALALCLGGGALAFAGAAKAQACPDVAHPDTRSVIVATGGAPWDAQVAGPLASALAAPIVLNPPGDVVGSEVRSVLGDWQPDLVVILGSGEAVSASVQEQLNAEGRCTVRMFGADRYGTAADVASHLRRVLLIRTP